MNKDLDERLLPEGEYRDASNIQISSTEANDAGTVQNVLGNKYANKTASGTYTGTYGIGGKCVGSIENNETNKLYLFIKGTSVNAIVEYNAVTETSIPVIVDTRSGITESTKNILNFTDTKITGIAILQDYLIFTDNNSEPKIIDISDDSVFKSGSASTYDQTTRINEQAFRESDITLIRKKPHNAPKVVIETTKDNSIPNEDLRGSKIVTNNSTIYGEKFVKFAYRWKFKNGQYSAFSPFSETVFFPNSGALGLTISSYSVQDGENTRMINNVTKASLFNIECGNGRNNSDILNNIEYVDILYKESNNTNIYIYKTISIAEALTGYSGGISVNDESKKSVIPDDQLFRVFDNVPYRAKALDTVGNRLIFGNYKDGIDIEGFSPVFNSVDLIPRTFVEDEITRTFFNASDTTAPGFVGVDNNTVKDSATVKSGRNYQIGIVFEDEHGRQTPVTTSPGGFKKVPYTTYSTGSANTNGFGNRFEITMEGLPPGVGGDGINGEDEYSGNGSRKDFPLKFPNKPKTINDFAVYVDDMDTPKIPKTSSANNDYDYNASTGTVTFTSAPAAEARIIFDLNRIKRFKYFIKENKGQAYNLVASGVEENTEDGGDTAWLVIPSFEIDKVQKSDSIILKKPLNTTHPVDYGKVLGEGPDDYTFKVLDLSETRPQNMAGGARYDDSFFIKVKNNTALKSNLTAAQGIAGSDNSIPSSKFSKIYKTALAETSADIESNGLSLGSYAEQFGNEFMIHDFYFYGGSIYEILYPQSATVTSTFSDTMNQNNICSNNDADGYAISTSSPDLSGIDHIDLVTNVVENVYYKHDGAGRPTEFYICYSSTAATNSVGSAFDIGINVDIPAQFEVIPKELDSLDVYYETAESFPIKNYGDYAISGINQTQKLSFTNAFMGADGTESNRIKDTFTGQFLENGVKLSTTITDEYTERHQKNSLIFSGIFNSESDVNKLNEFNPGLKITKEINPEYGSIQKLHTRNTDIIALCEDKILRVLANKDALFNSDGNVNLTSNQNVLGQAIAYKGEYGISKNPESFASHGYRAYFTDKSRGSVLRLTQDGLTVISAKGMTSYFRENLIAETEQIVGSFDVYSQQYILTIPAVLSSLAFKEDVDGWISRLSFLPDTGISVNGKYYTCSAGELYQHHAAEVNRNNFYGIQHTSGLKFIFNQDPSTIKNFQTISYEGTTGWLSKLNGIDVITTDQQTGEIINFTKKEGKYFANISGTEEELNTLSGTELDSKLKNFSIQGLGNIANHSGVPFTTTTTTTTSTTTTTTSTTTTTTTLDCGLTLAVGSYSNNGCTITGTFGSSYTNSDNLILTVSSGTIGDGTVTKSELAAGHTTTMNEGATITARVISGLCVGTRATINAPQSSTVVVQAPTTAFTHDNVTLSATTTGTVNTFKWFKGTASNSLSEIAGATSSTLTTTETTADTIYYKCQVNGTTDSSVVNIVWSARTSYTARFQSGTEVAQAACTASSTTRTIFGNDATFDNVTQFFTDIQGNINNFQQGTYSNSTDGSNNKYRFINEFGIPNTAIVCSTNSAVQAITVTACRNSSVVKNFNVTKSTSVADLVANKVIDFTATDSSGFTHWVVTNANYTGGSFDGTPTLANVNNADTCIAQDPPTLAITATGSVVRGQTITLTATPSHSSQGGTYSYQFQRSTDDFASNSSSVGGAISGTAAAKSTTTTESTADSLHFRCVLNGSITSNKAPVIVSDYQSVSLKRTAGGDIAAKTTACNSTDLVTLYYNQLVSNLSGSTVLYTDAAGATGTITAGTYSDGTHYAYVNASRSVLEKTVDGTTTRWHVCTGTAQSITITGAATANTNDAAQLTASASNYVPTSFTWKRTPPGGSEAIVQGPSSDPIFYASESSAGAFSYKVIATDEAGVSKEDTHTVTFSVPTQTVTVQACPGGGTSYNIKITNATGFAVGNVVQLASFEGGNAGSYKVTNASAGSFDDTTTATNTSAFDSCCSSLGCSVTISDNQSGAGAILIGTSVTLTAAAVNYTAATFNWQVSTDGGSSYGSTVGTSSTFNPDNSGAGTKKYKCTIVGSQSESEFATKDISWFEASEQERTYRLLACDDDFLKFGTFTSVNPLASNTVVDIGTGVCFQTGTYFEGASQPTADGAISEQYADCAACNNAQARTDDCTANFSSGSYTGGSYTLTGFFGTSYSDTDEFTLSSNNGSATVSGSNIVTVSVLKAGATVTAVAGATITLTSRFGANCVNTTHTTIVPLSTCNSVQVYYSVDNPQSNTAAANNLCGGGTLRLKTAFMNGTTLASSQVVYSNNTCSNLLGGTKYFTQDNANYYIWNGYSLTGSYTIPCP